MGRLRALVATSLLAGLVVAVPSAAHAVAPSSVTWTPVAPRSEGDGYAAAGASIDPWDTEVAPDGAVLFFDQTARRIRRIDPSSGVITSIAGDGTALSYCSPAYGADGRALSLPAPRAIAPAGNGDLFVLVAPTYYCDSPGVLRLDHSDHQWHLAAAAPGGADRYTKGYGDFAAIAVDAGGTLYVTDGFGHRILAYPAGSDPTAMGTVVAGTGAIGIGGDGGAASAAQVNTPRLFTGPGALYMNDTATGALGTVVRRLDLTTGVITRIAGTGTPYSGSISGPNPAVGSAPTSADMSIEAMSVDPVSGLVALGLLRQDPSTAAVQHDIVSFTSGGVITDVRSGPDASLYTDPGMAVQHTGSRVLSYGYGELRAWRTSGADAGTLGSVVAGLGSGASASGAVLEDEFPGQLTSMATSSSGNVALSGAYGVRTFASLVASAPVTVVSPERANAVDFAADGSLWWARDTAVPALVRKTAAGAPSVVAGGGAGALVDGAAATSVALPPIVDLAADSSVGVTYFLAESGTDNSTYVGRRFLQLWSLTTSDSKLHLIAGDGTAGTIAFDGEAALSAPLGDASAVAVDATHTPLVSTDSGVFRVSAGAVHGPIAPRLTRPMNVTSSGAVVSGGSVYAADSSHSAVVTPTAYDLTAPLPDGSWLAATQGNSGSLLQRSDVVTPVTAAPTSTLTVTPGAGTLTVTVTPPSVVGLGVGVSITSQPLSNGVASIDYFVTDGSTAPRTYVVRRYDAPGYGGALSPATTYRVDVSTQTQGVWQGSTVSKFGAPLVDSTPPPAPTNLSWSEPLTGSTGVSLVPGDAPDIDRVVVCEYKGAPKVTTPDTCTGDGGGSWSVTSPATTTFVPVTVSFDVGRYSPVEERTVTAWTIDLQGNVSAPATLTLLPATPSADPGIVPGIEWDWDAASNSTWFRFRADPQIAAIAAGAGAPPVPAPYGGVDGGRTWLAGNLVPGQVYTVGFYRWSADSTHYTPTTVTFVAGTSSSDVVSVGAPNSVAYGAKPLVKAVVRRTVSSGTVGAGPLPGMPVELWKRTAPSTVWVRAGSATTAADGTAAWPQPAVAGRTSYQVRVPAQGYTHTAIGASPALVMGVKPVERASLSASLALLARSVRVGRSVTMTVRLAPRRTLTVWVQQYLSGKWRTAKVTRTSSLGVLSYAFRPTVRGTTLLRVVTPATSTLLSGVSNAVTIRAR